MICLISFLYTSDKPLHIYFIIIQANACTECVIIDKSINLKDRKTTQRKKHDQYKRPHTSMARHAQEEKNVSAQNQPCEQA